jgi:hypothetical protein
MRGSDMRTGELFSYVDLEDRVPRNHPLRLIRRVINEVLTTLDRACSGSRQAGVVRLPWVHALLRDPSERLGLRAREETGGQANACQASRDQGAAHGHTARRNRKAGPLALPGSARLDGLLCCANERLSDLSIPASHDRTLARRSDASKSTTSINVDENEENR